MKFGETSDILLFNMVTREGDMQAFGICEARERGKLNNLSEEEFISILFAAKGGSQTQAIYKARNIGLLDSLSEEEYEAAIDMSLEGHLFRIVYDTWGSQGISIIQPRSK